MTARVILVGGDGRPSGVPRHICDLALALEQDAQITVLSEADQGGFRTLPASAQHAALPGLASRLRPGPVRRGYQALVGALRAQPADLVWLHARLPVLLGRIALARRDWLPEGPVALTYHGLPFGPGHRAPLSMAFLRIERLLLRICPPMHLVFLSAAQRDAFVTAVPAARRHDCHVLRNASRLGPLPEVPRAPGRHIVMTGRAGRQKNLEYAAALLRHLPSDMRLTLSGFGTDDPGFQARLARLAGPAAGRLRCLGSVTDVRPLLAAADAVMLTSRYEGVPIGALEAMEAGLPLIVTPFAGVETLTQGHPAALTLSGDPGPDGQAIGRFLEQRHDPAAIRTYWAARWSPARFDADARALVQKMCAGH